jgi:hypothetical protein
MTSPPRGDAAVLIAITTRATSVSARRPRASRQATRAGLAGLSLTLAEPKPSCQTIIGSP